MLKTVLSAFFILYTCFAALSQTCLPEGITFNTQSQINNFHTNYPNCTGILGNVVIDPQGGNITSLVGLSGLATIGGNLVITNSSALVNLTGLNALTTIGGDFNIYYNTALTSLSGLNNLTSVGGDVRIGYFNPNLANLTGLNHLATIGGGLNIQHNSSLQNLNGLQNLNTVTENIGILENQNLNNLTGLSGLNQVPDIFIQNNPNLTSLNGLENYTAFGKLDIYNNATLSNLNGLQNAVSINGIRLSYNPLVTSLSPLSNVTSLESGFDLDNMNGITDLQGLGSVSSTGGFFLRITYNASLLSLNGLNPTLTDYETIYLAGNPLLADIQVFEQVTNVGIPNPDNCIYGLSILNCPSISSLATCQNMVTIGCLDLEGLPLLTDMSGFGKLESVGSLVLQGNDGLVNLNGMPLLGSAKYLGIGYNPQLTSISGLQGIKVSESIYIAENSVLENLDGLQATSAVKYLYVGYNASMNSLTGLNSITKISSGISLYNNPALTDLDGLGNLTNLSGYFYVSGNTALTDCAVLGVCLLINNSDSVWISNNAPGCNSEAEVDAQCNSVPVVVETRIDQEANCAFGIPVSGVVVQLKGAAQMTMKPGDADGVAAFEYYETGQFTLTLPEINPDYWDICEIRQYLTAFDGGDSIHVFLYLAPLVQCPDLRVKLNLPANFRGCTVVSELTATVQNNGTVPAESTWIAVVMPPVFDLLGVLPPVSGQNGDTLFFDAGELTAFETNQLILSVRTKCDTFLMGQTLCWEAFAGAGNTCAANPQPHSEIKLSAACAGNSTVRFTLKNIGNAATQGFHQYQVMRNESVYLTDVFNLGPQQSMTVDFPADGSTWRMEATKFNDGTKTAVALENCGGLTPGYITAFWLDHGPAEYDFDCRQVVQSFDPNRKTAIPVGTGFEHIIRNDAPIFYTIDFQNTGTDTAFKVLLTDRLPAELDVSSFRPEGASHPCTWTLDGRNLEVLFLPIALPDSNVNEPASHGNFSFSIRLKGGLPNGTTLYNDARIYFDANWPIWTNEVVHTLGQLTVEADDLPETQSLWQVWGNPLSENAIFSTTANSNGEKQFELYDATGKLLRRLLFRGNTFEFQRENLSSGLYFFKISDNQNSVFSGKIVVSDR